MDWAACCHGGEPWADLDSLGLGSFLSLRTPERNSAATTEAHGPGSGLLNPVDGGTVGVLRVCPRSGASGRNPYCSRVKKRGGAGRQRAVSGRGTGGWSHLPR